MLLATGGPARAAAVPIANLVAGRFTASVVDSGRTLELDGSAANTGTADAPPTTLRVTIGTSDVLPEQQLPAIAAGKSVPLQLDEIIPVDVRGTGQAITVQLDPDNQVTESTKKDNTTSTKAFFPALPDLTLEPPASLRVENGTTIAATVTVVNKGTADAGATMLAARADGVSNTTPVLPLAKGASQSVTVDLVVPAAARVGQVSVTLQVDPADVVAEQDESNNSLTPTPITIAPDLALESVTPTPTGRSVALNVRIEDAGNAASGPTQVHASAAGWVPRTVPIGSLAPGASTDVTLALTAPPSAQGHDADITVVVDQVPGDAAGNNSRTVPVHIAAPAPTPTPDLFIRSVRQSHNRNELSLSVEVGNAGGAPAGATRVHASAPGWTGAVASVRRLAVGDHTSVPLVLTVPQSARGHRVEFIVNVDPVTGDPSGNNVAHVPVAIPSVAAAAPDVAVSGLSGRRSGKDFVVDAAVANVGLAAANGIRLELRADGWPTATRTLGSLPAGRTAQIEFALRVPGDVGAAADFRLSAAPVPGERNLANNLTTASFPVPPLPPPHRRWWPYALAGVGALLALSLVVGFTLRGRRLRAHLLWQAKADGERPETCEVPQAHVLRGDGKPKPAFRTIETLGLSIPDERGEEQHVSIDGAIVDTLNRALWWHRFRRRRHARTLVEPLGERLAREIERHLAERRDIDVAVSAEIKGAKLEYEFTRSECVREHDSCRWDERDKWKGEREHKVEEPVAAVHMPLQPREDRVRQLSADLVALIDRVDVPRRVRAPEATPVPRE